jgi:hypothetical protein
MNRMSEPYVGYVKSTCCRNRADEWLRRRRLIVLIGMGPEQVRDDEYSVPSSISILRPKEMNRPL